MLKNKEGHVSTSLYTSKVTQADLDCIENSIVRKITTNLLMDMTNPTFFGCSFSEQGTPPNRTQSSSFGEGGTPPNRAQYSSFGEGGTPPKRAHFQTFSEV